MKRILIFGILMGVFSILSCGEIEEAIFKDVKGIFKGTTKEYLNVTIDISKQEKDKLEGIVKFEVNPAKVPEGDTLVKYLPTKDSDFKGEIVINKVVLTTTEYTVKIDNKDVPIKIVFDLTRSDDGKKLSGEMTFSGIEELGKIPIEVTKQ
ncbi:MAG: hypothetical protein N2746_06245 [Deltaproteobacteria bacterium]|nr:hypothetical protein [Deltaproteobacteria bacterium]